MGLNVHHMEGELQAIAEAAPRLAEAWGPIEQFVTGRGARAGEDSFRRREIRLTIGYSGSDTWAELDLAWLAKHATHDIRPYSCGMYDDECWKWIRCSACGVPESCSLKRDHPGECVPKRR